MPRAVSTRAAVAPPAPLPTMMASGCSDAMPHLRLAAPTRVLLRRPVRAEPAPHDGVAVAAPARVREAALDAVVAHGGEDAPLVEALRQALGLTALELTEEGRDLLAPQRGETAAAIRLPRRLVEGRQRLRVQVAPALDLVVAGRVAREERVQVVHRAGVRGTG